MEIVTTVDKDARDRMYKDLKENGNNLEQQVVKFSDCEPVLDANVQKTKFQTRPVYQSTYSIAYPRS